MGLAEALPTHSFEADSSRLLEQQLVHRVLIYLACCHFSPPSGPPSPPTLSAHLPSSSLFNTDFSLPKILTILLLLGVILSLLLVILVLLVVVVIVLYLFSLLLVLCSFLLWVSLLFSPSPFYRY